MCAQAYFVYVLALHCYKLLQKEVNKRLHNVCYALYYTHTNNAPKETTMNTKQAATARRLSLRCADFCHDGNIAFVAESLPGDTVLFRATNVFGDLRWYESAEDFMCFIGPRGGVRRATGSLARYVGMFYDLHDVGES